MGAVGQVLPQVGVKPLSLGLPHPLWVGHPGAPAARIPGGRGPPECGRFPGTWAHCLGLRGNIRTRPQGPSSTITRQLPHPPGPGRPAHCDEARPPLRSTRQHQEASAPGTDVGAGTLGPSVHGRDPRLRHSPRGRGGRAGGRAAGGPSSSRLRGTAPAHRTCRDPTLQ